MVQSPGNRWNCPKMEKNSQVNSASRGCSNGENGKGKAHAPLGELFGAGHGLADLKPRKGGVGSSGGQRKTEGSPRKQKKKEDRSATVGVRNVVNGGSWKKSTSCEKKRKTEAW